MADLNRFIMNTDYDSLKVVEEIEWNMSYPQTTLNAGQSSSIEYVHNTEEGVYFESQSTTLTLFPDLALTGSSYLSASKNLTDGDNSTYITVTVRIYKKDKTTYATQISIEHPSISGSTASVTVPAFDISVKLNLLVPSEQQ